MLLPTKLSVRALPELWATRGQNVDNWNALRVLIVLWEDLVSKTNVWMPAGNILSAIYNMFQGRKWLPKPGWASSNVAHRCPRRLLFCQKLGGQLPNLPTRHIRPGYL